MGRVILSAVQWRFGGPTVCGFLNRSPTITITAGRQQRRRGSLRLCLVIFYGSRCCGNKVVGDLWVSLWTYEDCLLRFCEGAEELSTRK